LIPSGVSNPYFTRSASVFAMSSSWTAAFANASTRPSPGAREASAPSRLYAARKPLRKALLISFERGGGASIADAQLAHDAVRLAQRKVLGRRAERGALDQLLQPLTLLLQRPFRHRPAFFPRGAGRAHRRPQTVR
jgi:hypothetical protein